MGCSLLLFGNAFLTTEKHQETVPAYASEESGVTDFVSRLYTVILERSPDEAGLAEWTGYLEDGVFMNCTGLEEIDIPKCYILGASVFSGLESFTIPEGVKTIGEYAFDGCTGLSNVELPDSLTKLNDFYTFDGCISLTEAVIPDSVTAIQWSTFRGCTNLTIYCPSGSYAETFAIENDIPYVIE